MENNNKLLNGVIHEGKPHIIELVDTSSSLVGNTKKKTQVQVLLGIQNSYKVDR